jgi:hypothetical protein
MEKTEPEAGKRCSKVERIIMLVVEKGNKGEL